MSTSLESLLQERGAVLRGHFQYASGRHGAVYIEKFRILQWPDVAGPMCKMIADHFQGKANLVVYGGITNLELYSVSVTATG